MKKFFLFTERGITERFFCGNIYEANTSDTISYHGIRMTFADCENQQLCKSFETRKEANIFRAAEEEAMQDSNEYAREAMFSEERYGCEGVDH